MDISYSKRFMIQKQLNHNSVLSFLNTVEEIFNMRNKAMSGIVFDLSYMNETNILGLLLIYKMVEFSVENRCFNNPVLIPNSYITDELKKYGFWNLLDAYLTNKSANYDKLNFKTEGAFFVAPLALLRKENYSEKVIRERFMPNIERYYDNNPKAVSMILSCMSEVILNFWEHAVEDTKSIFVASGNKNKVEIACADTGDGIISTLSSTLSEKSLPKEEVLMLSLQKGVTSKKMTNHMGYGLWILNELVSLVRGRLHIYSEGAYVFNNYGKIKKGTCAFWKGTVIYVSLPLSSPKTLADIQELVLDKQLNDIKIDFS